MAKPELLTEEWCRLFNQACRSKSGRESPPPNTDAWAGALILRLRVSDLSLAGDHHAVLRIAPWGQFHVSLGDDTGAPVLSVSLEAVRRLAGRLLSDLAVSGDLLNTIQGLDAEGIVLAEQFAWANGKALEESDWIFSDWPTFTR